MYCAELDSLHGVEDSHMLCQTLKKGSECQYQHQQRQPIQLHLIPWIHTCCWPVAGGAGTPEDFSRSNRMTRSNRGCPNTAGMKASLPREPKSQHEIHRQAGRQVVSTSTSRLSRTDVRMHQAALSEGCLSADLPDRCWPPLLSPRHWQAIGLGATDGRTYCIANVVQSFILG